MAVKEEHLNRAVLLAKPFGATRLILFGSAVIDPNRARDIDFACDGIVGWKLFEFGARLEDELLMPVDLIPLSPPNRLARLIERRGRVLM
jgi:predicted nucleotidyltransferase